MTGTNDVGTLTIDREATAIDNHLFAVPFSTVDPFA